MSNINTADLQRQAQATLNKAQAQGQQALNQIKQNTLISTLVRYSLLIESTCLTVFGIVHFFFPAAAAQFTFPSNITNWPHYQIALQGAGAMAILFASALCTLSFYSTPHTNRSLGSGHALAAAMLGYVHHSWTSNKALEHGHATTAMAFTTVLLAFQAVHLLVTASQLPELPTSEHMEESQRKRK